MSNINWDLIEEKIKYCDKFTKDIVILNVDDRKVKFYTMNNSSESLYVQCIISINYQDGKLPKLISHTLEFCDYSYVKVYGGKVVGIISENFVSTVYEDLLARGLLNIDNLTNVFIDIYDINAKSESVDVDTNNLKYPNMSKDWMLKILSKYQMFSILAHNGMCIYDGLTSIAIHSYSSITLPFILSNAGKGVQFGERFTYRFNSKDGVSGILQFITNWCRNKIWFQDALYEGYQENNFKNSVFRYLHEKTELTGGKVSYKTLVNLKLLPYSMLNTNKTKKNNNSKSMYLLEIDK